MKLKIRRKCKCGCGQITSPGKKYINGHNRRTKYPITKIRRRCKCGCGEIANLGRKYINGHNSRGNTWAKGKRVPKLSFAMIGNTNAKGTICSNETKNKIALNNIRNFKYNPNYKYCDIWKDKEYVKDLRKDYCENIDCEENYKRLCNHHIDLDKKNCNPKNIMTLCNSCHISLHNNLQGGKKIIINPKDFIVINRKDHISYINKRTRKIIVIRRVNTNGYI